ncbi:MAG: hypothetical protein DWC02_00150 [Candidatus Poseidoniales archaeon]|nr:MAG: hypothetical protein DWC02_00150 [Candidatus Poseidoniales archaeon]
MVRIKPSSKTVLALMMVTLMTMSGCTGLVDNDEDSNDPKTTLDLGEPIMRSTGAPELIKYSDCDELEFALKLSIEEETRTSLLQAVEELYYWGGGWMEDDMEMAADSSSSSPSSSPTPRKQGTDFSGTNNQEQGVDEADFVKTDGYHIYFLDSGLLHIMDVPEFGELEHSSTTKIEGSPVAMMLNEDTLVVVSTVSSWNINSEDPLAKSMGWGGDWYGWRTSILTKFTVLDVSDSSDPEVNRELYIEGSYLTAREVDGSVRAVTHAWMDIPGLQTWLNYPDGYWDSDVDEEERRYMREVAASEAIANNIEVLDEISLEEMLPQVHERFGDQIITHHMNGKDCSDFASPEGAMNRGYTSIFTLDLNSEDFEFEADHIVGNWPQVYASQDTLIITENAWDWWWFWGNDDLDEGTNIHTFDISDPSTTTYSGSARVEGTIQNQFSISEYEGVVRVATTTGQWGRWWLEDPELMENHVICLTHTLDENSEKNGLTEIGRVDGIAYNESIWSARFVEDRAYIVTFENMDPLWTINLSDPTSPRVMGELEVPGVSTYIHPLSNNSILTIGLGPADEETGLGLDWGHTRLSLFDVSNFSDPRLTQALSVSPVQNPEDGWSWAWSEATWEHKAFQYWEPKGMLAIPMNTYRYDSYYDDSGRYHYEYEWISKLMIVNVTEEGLEIHGEVNHSQFYENDEDRWWSSYNIRRSIFMGEYIYAISHGGITVTHLDSLEESDSHQFQISNQSNQDVVYSEESEDDKNEG